MDRSFTNIFKDNLDTVLGLAIKDRFGEPSGEHSEGVTEFGNPQTVTQPVNPSQLPSGQPLVNLASLNSPIVLILGSVVLIGAGLLLARAIR